MNSQPNEKILLLEKIPLFRGLSCEQLMQIANVAFYKTYQEEEIIIKEGIPANYLYIIYSGKVKIIKKSKTGKTKILGFLTQGDFVGEISLLTDFNPSATVECKEETKVLLINREDFIDLIRNNFEIALRILQEISRRLYLADIEIVDLSFESITHRFINTIILLAQKTQDIHQNQLKITIPLTHKEIAEIIGTRRELVTKLINHLKREGLISITRDRCILIKDLKTLRSLLK